MNIALDHGLLQRGGEAGKILGIAAHAHNQIPMIFGMNECILQFFHRYTGHLNLDAAPGKISLYQRTQGRAHKILAQCEIDDRNAVHQMLGQLGCAEQHGGGAVNGLTAQGSDGIASGFSPPPSIRRGAYQQPFFFIA